MFAIFHIKKEGRDKVDFLLGDKHQTLLQVDTINLGGHGWPGLSKLPEITTLQFLLSQERGEV